MARDNDLRLGTAAGVRLAAWASVAFLFLPIPVLVLYSFNAGRQVTHWEGFSLKWYATALSDRSVWLGVRNSLIIATASTLISTVLGTAAALVLAKYTFRGRMLFQSLIYIPVILPEIIFGLSLLALFVFMRMPLGFTAVICSHATFSMSFVALIVLARLHHFDWRLEEASLDLGATRLQTFFRIVLPEIAPGIMSGAMFAFTMSLDDFISTLFTASASSGTLPLRIYALVKYGITPELNAVSTLLILVTLGALWAGYHLQKNVISRRMLLGLGGGTVATIGFLLILSVSMADDDNTLNLYNYAGYFDDAVLADFEKETGIRVTWNFYNDNVELLARMSMGACDYDVVVPCDYMVGILVKLGLLARIDADNVPNIVNIDDRFRRMPFEPTGDYYVPYTYGCTGISYNSKKVSEPVESWTVLLNSKYKDRILMLDDVRECFGLAFRLQGHSLTDKKPDELRQALSLLEKQRPLVRRYDSSTIQDLLLGNEVFVAQCWSGIGLRLSMNHPEFRFVLPREGMSMFVDTLCIPKNARHKKNAERFLNFMMRPDIAARNMKGIFYPMPNTKAPVLLPGDVRKVLDPMLNMDLKRLELVGDLGEFTKDVDRAWTELRSRSMTQAPNASLP
jgi:spermidine/putrescine transport system permease protein